MCFQGWTYPAGLQSETEPNCNVDVSEIGVITTLLIWNIDDLDFGGIPIICQTHRDAFVIISVRDDFPKFLCASPSYLVFKENAVLQLRSVLHRCLCSPEFNQQ